MVVPEKNGHELGKAILEPATLAKPSVRFTGAHDYGSPPDGIIRRAEPTGTMHLLRHEIRLPSLRLTGAALPYSF